MGHAGLALSTSAMSTLGAAALFVLLSRKVHGIHGRRLTLSVLKIAFAAALMGVVCRVSSGMIHAAAGVGRAARLTDVAVSIPLGAAVFYLVAHALGVEELKAVKNACYTSKRNAPRPEVGDPPARSR